MNICRSFTFFFPALETVRALGATSASGITTASAATLGTLETGPATASGSTNGLFLAVFVTFSFPFATRLRQ